nr:PREDICTED: S100P-binding protein [Stegastes partitus]
MRGQSTVDDLCSSVSGPLLEPLILPVECLQGEEEMLHIGPPIFESSVCDSDPVKLNATSEQNGQGSEETKEDVKDSVHNYQDTTLDGSSSTSLPLQVQVKSKVVIPTTSSIPVPPLPPGENTKLKESNQNKDRTVPTAKHGKNQRVVVLNRQVDWEYKKNQYVHSVTQHLTENPGANHGVMSELLSLMSHVADQTTGSNGTQWQHPSDLTRSQSYGFETKPLSPDLGCVMDYCSPLSRWKPMSPLTDSFQDCLDTTWDSSSPMTLTHREQLVGQYTTISKQETCLPPEKYLKDDRTAKDVQSRRPAILNPEVDWELEKNLYVRSVNQHMAESPGGIHDVMSELLSLMIHVADQTSGSHGTQWQHPSDLTRRNHQRRVRKQRVTLHEWRARNFPTYKRFANVPKVFKRNPFP